ncbi:MAG: TIGR02281 family clan AA aspartic protease [Rhodobacterales bacterium]|nr:MAG: TIGR02281 family clan AA aspartic protease [Rhodobacterales bacterium]
MSDYGSLIYLVLLLCAVVGWFIAQNRASLGKLAQQALAWGLIFAGALAVVALWEDIRGAVSPSQAVYADQGRIELPRAADGHYYLTAEVNGTPVRFTVDTGATEIVLSRQDALAVGIDPGELAFLGSAQTANGEVRMAPVRLDTFDVGAIRDTRLRAFVSGGAMVTSLLGMAYLQRYSRIEIADGALILTR